MHTYIYIYMHTYIYAYIHIYVQQLFFFVNNILPVLIRLIISSILLYLK